MTKIRLQSIALQNFKGTRYLLLNLDGKNINISGRNGTGKTTVYKAYYWCLTGKTLEPNETVQMLDANNEIVHKIETSVTVTLRIDDSYDVCLQRKLVEDWKALGQPDEQLKGSNQYRFWNDVPLKMNEFNAKLQAICDIEKWLLLSDITKFMSLKVDDRRKLLLSIAGEVDENELMKPYPELIKAVAEKKSIDELKIQTLSTKKRSNDELKTIPSQISAQDNLRVNEDFEALKQKKAELDSQIADIDKLMQGSTEELQAVKAYNDKVALCEASVNNYKREWNKKRYEELKVKNTTFTDANKALMEAQSVAEKHKKDNDERVKQKAELQQVFDKIHADWDAENAREFVYSDNDSCPYCGHKYSTEEKEAQKSKAISVFNIEKVSNLSRLQKDAELQQQQILALTASIDEYNKVISLQDETAVDAKKTALNEAQTEYDTTFAKDIERDVEYITLKNALEAAVSNKPNIQQNTQKEEQEAKKRELVAQRDDIIRLLAGEQTNQRIADEKIRLGKRSQELAQIIANCDKILWEISEYRRSKVNAVEGKVNAFFNLARWKFYEKNVTNDDLQEVCICHHNGVDFNSTNGADKINLAVDIIAGLAKAYGIEVPLFVDNVESVNTLIPTESQQITLRVTTSEFKAESF